MFLLGAKLTVPLSNTIFPLRSRLPVLAALDAKLSFAEKFSPSSAAMPGLETSVRTYQTFFFVSFRDPLYRGIVIVPFATSIGPVFKSWTGPTRLWLVDEGGGPKYESGTFVPTDAGAGNRLQPGPGPIGPGPGP